MIRWVRPALFAATHRYTESACKQYSSACPCAEAKDEDNPLSSRGGTAFDWLVRVGSVSREPVPLLPLSINFSFVSLSCFGYWMQMEGDITNAKAQ